MEKLDISYKIFSFVLIFTLLALTGCSRKPDILTENSTEKTQPAETPAAEESPTEEPPETKEPLTNISPQTAETITDEIQQEIIEPTIADVDWSGYFDGINGAAVIYDPAENCYQIYNRELALTQRSPCSTFKIISSLVALENGIIDPNNSIRTWSGEIESDISIYGKTGMGKANGILLDSWFTGFADTAEKRIYFCVYLGETENQNVSSATAREIAVRIVSDYL